MEENEQQENIDSKYLILEKIGSGGQANVFRVVKIGTNEEYAAKVFKSDDDSITNEINMLQEVKQYQCPYIINIIASGEGNIVRKNRKTEVRKYFVIEKEPYGSILDYIYYKEQGVGELYSKIIFQKILIGFQCLHKHNICHRDIKLDNILFDVECSPKICDFGHACFNSNHLIFDRGTDIFKPPEANGKTEYDGIKGDIFYLASTLMILTTGIRAFVEPIENDSLFRLIINNKYKLYWETMVGVVAKNGIVLSDNFKELFWKMISYEPQNRPTIDKILEHPWFKDINDMKKNNLTRFQKLEKEIKDYFTSLLEEVKEQNIEYIKKEDYESTTAPYNKGGSNEKDEGPFDSNAMPKLLESPMNIKYCINIKGDLKPVNFMNRLCKKINDEFGFSKCLINTAPGILKLNLTFLNNIEKNENDEEKNDNNVELNEEKDENEEDDEDNNDFKIQIKLYKDSEKYILRFKEVKGDRKDFIDKYKYISNLVVELLKN